MGTSTARASILAGIAALALVAAGCSSKSSGSDAAATGAPSAKPTGTPIIIGIDPKRELLLAHQLRSSGGRQSLDLLRLGGGW